VPTTSQPGNYIHTLSLANNGFRSLSQLSRLPFALPHIRALDLSNNPIASNNELKHLQSLGEQKGRASTGAGSLKSLIELKLNGVKFRDQMLSEPNGGDLYQQ
jgi:nuclear RNA export factor